MEPNSFTKTSFCNVLIDNITTNKVKEYILNHLKMLFSGMEYNTRYAKIYNDNYSKNLNNPHIMYLKSSGTPYLLFLTQINGVNYNFLIDKKINEKYSYPKILIVPYKFSDDLYNGTLLECELIRNKNNNWSLGLNDIYHYKGNSMKNTIVIDRINNIYQLLKDELFESYYLNKCPLFVKKYFDYKDMEYIKNEFIPNLTYNIRGIYFIPLRTDYSNILYLLPRENNKFIKKDNKVNHSIKQEKVKPKKVNKEKVFRIIKTLKPDVYELYLKKNDNFIKKGNALIQNISLSHKLLSYFEKNEPTEEIKVKCEYNKDFKKWYPICLTKENISEDTL